jgi:phage host-nuclease inhibitor protein Gam
MKKSLYQIEQEYLQIAQSIEDADGVLDEQMEQQLMINQEELQTKAVKYALVIRQMDAEAAMLKAEIARMNALKKSKENAVARLKEAIAGAMQMYGITKIQGDLINLSFRKSQKVMQVDAEMDALSALPERFLRTKTEVDTSAIRASLKAGEEVDGFEMVENQSLQLK